MPKTKTESPIASLSGIASGKYDPAALKTALEPLVLLAPDMVRFQGALPSTGSDVGRPDKHNLGPLVLGGRASTSRIPGLDKLKEEGRLFRRNPGTLALFVSLLVAPPAWAGKHHPLPDGIVSVSTHSPAELQQMMKDGFRAEIPWDEAYGEFIDVDVYVPDLSVDQVWDYVQDIQNLKYWTMSMYDCQPMGTLNGRNRYLATEFFPPGGLIYLTEEKHEEVRTVEWWVGFAPDNIWMNYYVRVLDAQKFIGKPGAIITWVNYGHQNFEIDPALHEGWLRMHVAHSIERDNMIKVLRWKAAGNTGPLTPDVMAQIGLINGTTMSFDEIWAMLMSRVTPTVSWDDLYGGFITSNFIVLDAPKDKVWKYLTNLQNMNDWTVSTRFVIPYRDDFFAFDMLSPTGVLLGDTDVYQASRTLDIRVSNGRYHHQFGQEKWMTSSFHVKDAAEVVGKPGTVVFWTTYHHANYDARPELAEEWKYLPVRNMYAGQNLQLLLTASDRL